MGTTVFVIYIKISFMQLLFILEMLTFTFTIRGLYCLLLFHLLYIAFLFISVKNDL